MQAQKTDREQTFSASYMDHAYDGGKRKKQKTKTAIEKVGASGSLDMP